MPGMQYLIPQIIMGRALSPTYVVEPSANEISLRP